MTEPADASGRSREEEVLARSTRIAGAARGPGVRDHPRATRSASTSPSRPRRSASGTRDLPPDHRDEETRHGRRPRRPEAGHGEAQVPHAPRRQRGHPARLQPGGARRRSPSRSSTRWTSATSSRATGPVGTTRRGELSVFVDAMGDADEVAAPAAGEMARPQGPGSPAAAPLPPSDRGRDAAPPSSPRARRVLRALREVLHERGFVESEGPMLQTVAGGANARPFTTFHDALGIEMKLRISLELYLKRLLVGGVERVYELGRNFRNEGIDRDHNPEFTMLEAYQAYGDYTTMMELSEALVRESARAVNPIMGRDRGRPDDPVEGAGDRSRPAVPPARDARRRLGRDRRGDHARSHRPARDRGAARRARRRRRGVRARSWWSCSTKLVEETIVEPTFVCDFPREVSPLARPHRIRPGLTEHFDLSSAASSSSRRSPS